MAGARMNYLISIVGGETPCEFVAFLDDPKTAHLFDSFEQQVHKRWNHYASRSGINNVVQKWTPPLLENVSQLSKQVTKNTPPVVASLKEAKDTAPALAAAQSRSSIAPPIAPEIQTLATQAPPVNKHNATADANTTPAEKPLPAETAPVSQTKQVIAPLIDKGAPMPPPPIIRDRPPVSFHLRNARQSEPYREEIALEPANAQVRLVSVQIPGDFGLKCNLQTRLVEGIPAKTGDVSFVVNYRFTDDQPEVVRVAQLGMYINPDPKLLWKDLPSDRSDPLWKDDEDKQLLCGSERRVIAARKRGRSHAHVGSCCDDDFFMHHNSDLGWYVAIVADGAGSAKSSRLGSRVAVRTAGSFLKQALAGEVGEKVVSAVTLFQSAQDGEGEAAHIAVHHALFATVGYAAHGAMKALFDEAQKRSDIIQSVKDLSTTLLIGIARKFGAQWLCAAYWVGDGAVGVYRNDGTVELLGEVDAGEYSGQTRFLDANEVSQEALLKRTRFTLCDDFTAFILMTDGVSDPIFETEDRLAAGEAWRDLWNDLEAKVNLSKNDDQADIRLLEWLDFWSQGNHDDRTIALIY